MVERFLCDITGKRILRDCYASVADLAPAIDLYVAHHNIEPKPFIWTARGSAIPAKVRHQGGSRRLFNLSTEHSGPLHYVGGELPQGVKDAFRESGRLTKPSCWRPTSTLREETERASKLNTMPPGTDSVLRACHRGCGLITLNLAVSSDLAMGAGRANVFNQSVEIPQMEQVQLPTASADDEIIELSLSDLDVLGGAGGKCESSGTCDVRTL